MSVPFTYVMSKPFTLCRAGAAWLDVEPTARWLPLGDLADTALLPSDSWPGGGQTAGARTACGTLTSSVFGCLCCLSRVQRPLHLALPSTAVKMMKCGITSHQSANSALWFPLLFSIRCIDLVFPPCLPPLCCSTAELEVRDVTSKPEWEQRYAMSIPVLAAAAADGSGEARLRRGRMRGVVWRVLPVCVMLAGPSRCHLPVPSLCVTTLLNTCSPAGGNACPVPSLQLHSRSPFLTLPLPLTFAFPMCLTPGCPNCRWRCHAPRLASLQTPFKSTLRSSWPSSPSCSRRSDAQHRHERGGGGGSSVCTDAHTQNTELGRARRTRQHPGVCEASATGMRHPCARQRHRSPSCTTQHGPTTTAPHHVQNTEPEAAP